MDVLVLIDKLDELVQNAKGVPLSQDQVRVDREEIWEIIDQMRSTIPEEIKQARWIVKERQEMLAEAKREAERLIAEAREQAAREASQQEVVKLAERQAEDVLAEARRQDVDPSRAEDYADGILENLHQPARSWTPERGRAQLAKSDDRDEPRSITSPSSSSGARRGRPRIDPPRRGPSGRARPAAGTARARRPDICRGSALPECRA